MRARFANGLAPPRSIEIISLPATQKADPKMRFKHAIEFSPPLKVEPVKDSRTFFKRCAVWIDHVENLS
jgi:hypothetical protein